MRGEDGTAAARRLHRELRTEARAASSLGPLPIFELVRELDFTLLFRPLDKLLGASMRVPSAGMLISSERSLHIQRFTAAHELGHLILEHEGAIDLEMSEGAEPGANRDPQEVEADAFATELLLPRWLFELNLSRHGWTIDQLRDPALVYQLSLRLGASYKATCWGLFHQQLILRTDAALLLGQTPKKLKADVLRGVKLEDAWADVWALGAHDGGVLLECGPNDVFVLTLEEHGSAGYLWEAEGLHALGFEVVEDEGSPGGGADIKYGRPSVRRIVFRARRPAEGSIALAEKRPFAADAVRGRLELRFDLRGRELGLPRVDRRALAASA